MCRRPKRTVGVTMPNYMSRPGADLITSGYVLIAPGYGSACFSSARVTLPDFPELPPDAAES